MVTLRASFALRLLSLLVLESVPYYNDLEENELVLLFASLNVGVSVAEWLRQLV